VRAKSTAVPTLAIGTCGFETAREGDLRARATKELTGPTHQQSILHPYRTGMLNCDPGCDKEVCGRNKLQDTRWGPDSYRSNGCGACP
jgi:hypothetical protein